MIIAIRKVSNFQMSPLLIERLLTTSKIQSMSGELEVLQNVNF